MPYPKAQLLGLSTMMSKMAISKIDRTTLGKEAEDGARLPCNLFGHLKRALELSISVRVNPLTIF